jgi:hypothetical protein
MISRFRERFECVTRKESDLKKNFHWKFSERFEVGCCLMAICRFLRLKTVLVGVGGCLGEKFEDELERIWIRMNLEIEVNLEMEMKNRKPDKNSSLISPKSSQNSSFFQPTNNFPHKNLPPPIPKRCNKNDEASPLSR